MSHRRESFNHHALSFGVGGNNAGATGTGDGGISTGRSRSRSFDSSKNGPIPLQLIPSRGIHPTASEHLPRLDEDFPNSPVKDRPTHDNAEVGNQNSRPSTGTCETTSPNSEMGEEPAEDQAIISQLPPVDRGRGAWTYLAVAFLVEGLCWGFPFSYGVFQSYYSHTPPFAGSKELSVIGTVSSGIPYLASPFIFTVINMYPNYRKAMMWFGLAMSILACVASSFATKPWHLIMTQGAMYGIGTVFLYSPTFSLLNEWFVRRRGLAFGVMFAGTGICGLILPFLFEKLLSSYGHATTLRIWGVVLLVLTAPALFFMKPRLPASAYQKPTINGKTKRTAGMNLAFIKSPLFLVLAFSNFFQGLGYFLPGIYLPSYAIDLSLPRIESTVVLSIFNLASVFGQIGLGFLSDRFDIHYVLFYSTSVSALAVYLLWGLSKNFAALISFSILYGISAGGYSVLWTKFAALVTGEDNSPMVLTLIGVFSFQRGIGNILSGPISSALVHPGHPMKTSGGGYGYGLRKYESMVLFVGTAMLVSCAGIGGKFVRKPQQPKGA